MGKYNLEGGKSMNNDPILTLAFVCIAIILIFFRFALPIIGIITSIVILD